MDDDQYALLTAELGYKKEGMSYLDFAAGFEGSSWPSANLSPTRGPAGLSE